MANSPLKFAIPGIGDMMKQIQAKSQKEKEIKAGTYKGDATYQAKTASRQKVGFGGPQTATAFQPAITPQPTITPQPDMTPKTKMPSNMNSMTTNMTDDKMPMEDEVMESNQGNNVGLTNTGSGSSAVADGPRGNDYGSMVSGGGAMNTIKNNTSSAFTMKESSFPLTEKQEKLDGDGDGDIDKTDLEKLRNNYE